MFTKPTARTQAHPPATLLVGCWFVAQAITLPAEVAVAAPPKRLYVLRMLSTTTVSVGTTAWVPGRGYPCVSHRPPSFALHTVLWTKRARVTPWLWIATA